MNYVIVIMSSIKPVTYIGDGKNSSHSSSGIIIWEPTINIFISYQTDKYRSGNPLQRKFIMKLIRIKE